MKHIVGFSGGADSQATALWVRNHFPPEDVILLNSDPGGNEHPLTTEFIGNYSANVFPVVTVHPIVADMVGKSPAKIAELGLKPDDPLTFDTLAMIKGRWPASQTHFCTTHLKLEPFRRWCWEQGAKGLNLPKKRRNGEVWYLYGHDGADNEGPLSAGYERYAGVRKDESEARKDILEREWDDYFLCWFNRPLADWTKQQVFVYLTDHGEKSNPLYELGFSRVGCAPCVDADKETIRMWAARFPEMIDKVRGWEQRTGRTFFPPIMPSNRKGGKRRHGFIDEVVEWSKTVHGGKQYSLPILEGEVNANGCMSQYGLCE